MSVENQKRFRDFFLFSFSYKTGEKMFLGNCRLPNKKRQPLTCFCILMFYGLAGTLKFFIFLSLNAKTFQLK